MPVPLLITPLKLWVRAGSNDGEAPGSTYAAARTLGPTGPVGPVGPVTPFWFQVSGFSVGLQIPESETRKSP